MLSYLRRQWSLERGSVRFVIPKCLNLDLVSLPTGAGAFACDGLRVNQPDEFHIRLGPKKLKLRQYELLCFLLIHLMGRPKIIINSNEEVVNI